MNLCFQESNSCFVSHRGKSQLVLASDTQSGTPSNTQLGTPSETSSDTLSYIKMMGDLVVTVLVASDG
jgi:hypothetical protein